MKQTLKSLVIIFMLIFGTVTLSLAASIAILPQAARLDLSPKNEQPDQGRKHQEHREDDEALIQSRTRLPLHQDFISNY
jgi:hypothetical protein